MKKIIGLLILFITFVSTVSVSFAWWNNTVEGANEEEFYLDYGLRIFLDNQTSIDQGFLVPKNSLLSNRYGYTDEYLFDYRLGLEHNLDVFDMIINVTNLKVGEIYYDNSPSVHGPLLININTSKGVFSADNQYDQTINKKDSTLKIEKVLGDGDSFHFTISFSLVEKANENFSEEDLESAYDYLAGKNVSFDLMFMIGIDNNDEEEPIEPPITPPITKPIVPPLKPFMDEFGNICYGNYKYSICAYSDSNATIPPITDDNIIVTPPTPPVDKPTKPGILPSLPFIDKDGSVCYINDGYNHCLINMLEQNIANEYINTNEEIIIDNQIVRKDNFKNNYCLDKFNNVCYIEN